MFAPLGFVPGLTPAQIAAVAKRGGWDAAGVPTVEHYMKLGSWFAGTPDDLVAHLKSFEERYPGMQLHQPVAAADDAEGRRSLEQYQHGRRGGDAAFPPAPGGARRGEVTKTKTSRLQKANRRGEPRRFLRYGLLDLRHSRRDWGL